MKQLPIPNKLYGREHSITALLEYFEHISSGHGMILLVPGCAGTGKTALAQELQQPIHERNGFFVSGKFDQYQQNIPYSAFRQVLTALCQQLLAWDTLQRSRIKNDILQTIGNLGQVLIDLVPEFESLLGKQPPLLDISPQEARYRFINVFENFLTVICQPEHPLVLFIDDWQWADDASFDLLKQIKMGSILRYLLIIVSYRDNEIDANHPLEFTLSHLRQQMIAIEMLAVRNISLTDIQTLLADTLKLAKQTVEPLASIVQHKTLGNPFFVKSFLNFLYNNNLIYFNATTDSWQWDSDRIQSADLPDNIVELFVLKFRQFDTNTQLMLSLAACLGNRFDLDTLSIISGQDSQQCQRILFSEQTHDVLLRLPEDSHNASVCMFVHDRLQQAARSLLDSAELPNILLKIGRLLLKNLRPEQLNDRLFEVVNNLNAGYLLITDLTEQVRLVELNIQAGRKAYHATAYRSALQYYQTVANLLTNADLEQYLWQQHHELMLSLFNELAECEFLEGNRAHAEQWIRKAVIHAKSAIEKANALNNLIVQYTLQAKYTEAISVGHEALATLGITLPAENYQQMRDQEIAAIRKKLQQRTVLSLFGQAVMSDPTILMVSKILITMGPPCYRAHPQLWSVIVPKVVNLTIDYGNIAQIGYSHPAFGGLLGWVDNDYTTARQFADLATLLMTETFSSASEQSVFYLMTGSSIRHWFKHLKYSSQDYQKAVEVGLQAGNMQYAAYAFGHNMYCQFYQGIPLASLITQTQQSIAFSRTRLNQWAIDLLEGGLQIFNSLAKPTIAIDQLNGSEIIYLQRVAEHRNSQVTCIYKVLKTFALFIANHYQAALALSNEIETLIYTVGTQGLLPWPEHICIRFLILTNLYPTATTAQQKLWRTELDAMLQKLQIWAHNCPENFAHNHLLAKAELAKLDNKPIDAALYYDKAIEAAQQSGFLNWEAIANELAYHFWNGLNTERIAHIYWRQAYILYDRWGVASKTTTMEAEFQSYLTEHLPQLDLADKQQVLKLKNTLFAKKVKQLQSFALQLQQAQSKAVQAEELTHAMQRLRLEIAERKQMEHYEQFRSHILELIASNNTLQDILHQIVIGLEQFKPAMLCSILLLDEEGKHLRLGVAPSLPEFYNTAIDGIAIGMAVGSCGTAAFTGKLVIVEDINTHPYWANYKALASQAKLRSCWSQAIYSSTKKILGTFAIYHRDVHVPNDTDIYLIEQFSRLASIAIEQKRMEEQIRQLAFYDSLTNLPNRRLLEERMRHALNTSQRSGKKGALLFIDMDNFKTLNDSLGHDKGDLLLQQVAKRLKNCVRETDTVARLGGDEFVVMLEGLSEQTIEAAIQTEAIGEKILNSLNKIYQLSEYEYHCSPSIGVSLFHNHSQSTENLLKQADIAMYQVKGAGRNALRFFDPKMQVEITAHATLENDLRRALAEQQFQLYYQPQFSYEQQLLGAEALIRWNHPQQGLIPPNDFIPIAEETGLILPIGYWVLETACLQKKIWESNPNTQHLHLAVNVSSKQFHQSNFVAQIQELITRTAINPYQLKLELTESLMLKETEDTIIKINALREIGLRFSIDDFGTGYSSLAYLTQLPVDQLKIDRSFIRNIGTKPTDAIIIQTIIGMAKNLNMEVIAEGVEKEEQCDFLKQHDCLIYQGYLFSKPVPLEQFEQLVFKNLYR